MTTSRRTLTVAAAAAALTVAAALVAPVVSAAVGATAVDLKVFAPHGGDNAGVGGAGWVVDLGIDYPSLAAAGFSGPQLTGPGGHANIAPFPGTFSPGADDHLPGLVVLVSTSRVGAGAGQNVANLFNLTGVTHRAGGDARIWDTWIVGGPNFGSGPSELTVAVIGDRNQNGVYDDAPAVVPDANQDGRIDRADVAALGVASEIRTVDFTINSAP